MANVAKKNSKKHLLQVWVETWLYKAILADAKSKGYVHIAPMLRGDLNKRYTKRKLNETKDKNHCSDGVR